MSENIVSSISLPEFRLWEKTGKKRVPIFFDLEITARCNNNCRHCYINLPVGDKLAKEKELTFEEIKRIADEAFSLGTLWCLITGGEPLLRSDFQDIYLYLKKKGFLISVFTNATLITEKHIEFFKKYPPRDIEVTVYGVTQETYERVTRKPGSFAAFMKGLNLLLEGGIKVRFKAIAIRSNVHELDEISRFCRERTKDYFRFDPLIHLRFDGDPVRNEEIKSERLSPEEIVAIERADSERFDSMEKNCDKFILDGHDHDHADCHHIFRCAIGRGNFNVGYDGTFRLCSSIWHPDCVCNLKNVSLSDAWHNMFGKVVAMTSDRKEFLENCKVCPLINLCLWCPAHAYLEMGKLDAKVDYFCAVANARAKSLIESQSVT